LREAPSLVNIPILLEGGANIKAWDPIGMNNFKIVHGDTITYCETIEETLKDTEICFIFTEWDEVKQLKPQIFQKLMRKPIVLDGRNCYQVSDFESSNVTYESIGRRPIYR